jgi:hypothetical protein
VHEHSTRDSTPANREEEQQQEPAQWDDGSLSRQAQKSGLDVQVHLKPRPRNMVAASRVSTTGEEIMLKLKRKRQVDERRMTKTGSFCHLVVCGSERPYIGLWEASGSILLLLYSKRPYVLPLRETSIEQRAICKYKFVE